VGIEALLEPTVHPEITEPRVRPGSQEIVEHPDQLEPLDNQDHLEELVLTDNLVLVGSLELQDKRAVPAQPDKLGSLETMEPQVQ